MLLVTADQMREMDRRTIEDIGIAGAVLMERAALGAVQALLAHFELQPGTRIGLLCGGGNNAGDGFAMARMLHELRFGVFVAAMRDTATYSGDAAGNLGILEELGVWVEDLSNSGSDDVSGRLEEIEPCTVWVDALFGTGLDRDVEGPYGAAIEFLNSQPRVFAVDIPSGIHADTGQVLGVGVRAAATAAFGHLKLGQALYPGREHCGALYPVDIGIPAIISERVGWSAEFLVEDPWLPPRPPTTHKGEAGRVVIVGGEPGKTGSVLMSAKAALRSGAGLVAVGTYDASVAQVAPVVPEAMASAILARTIEQAHVDELDDLIAWASVIAIGPGLGTHDGAFEVLEAVLGSDQAVVVDADGLTLLAEHRMQLQHVEVSRLVLTPHPGEAARLCGCTTEEILEDPIARALEIAADWNAIVVLKGASTVVAQHEPRQIAVNSTGNAGMATAGMGDALTGMIAAQLCDRLPTFHAVCAAVWAHGAAGDLAADAVGQRGVTVSGLLDELGAVWKALEAE